MNSISVEPANIPPDFTQRCINGEKGGVLLVYINGKDSLEVEKKKNEITEFVGRVRNGTSKEIYCCKYQTVDPKDFCDHCLKKIK